MRVWQPGTLSELDKRSRSTTVLAPRADASPSSPRLAKPYKVRTAFSRRLAARSDRNGARPSFLEK